MGLRDNQDARNSLVGQFARLVTELRPKCFVMENVPGMASGDTKPLLDQFVRGMEVAGYRITKPLRVLDASDFGVPQRRKRLFVLGVRDDLSVTISYPNGPCAGRPARPTVWEAIHDLPQIEAYDELFTTDEVGYDRPAESGYARVARGMLADPSDYSHPRGWPRDRCSGCLRIRHVAAAVELYRSTAPGRVVPGHKLPRLDPNGLCPTLRAGSDSSHGSYTAPRPVHPVQPRCITAREAARLHGFPDWFAFFPTKWHAYRQIGNAVCPPVARAIGAAVLLALKLRPTKPQEVVPLPTGFELAEDRPRTQKRIPHLRNYPPVIAHLFSAAFDDEANRLARPRFSFSQVEEAIRVTGVTLPWTRADTFVPELARSRSVRQLLASCLAAGYSIRPLGEGEWIGEFVQQGEAGDITDKDLIEVKSRDLAAAVELQVGARPDRLAELLDTPAVRQSIWGDTPAERYVTLSAAVGRPLTKGAVQRVARQASVSEVVVLSTITARHVAAIRFRDCLHTPIEVCRRLFITEVKEREEPTLFGPMPVSHKPVRRRRTP